MTRIFMSGLALLLCCSAALGLDFTSRSFDCAPNQKVFVSAFQRFAKLKDSDGPTTRYNPTAGAIGYVYDQGLWHAGAAITYEHGDRKIRYDGGGRYEVRTNLPGISLFGGMKTVSGWYVDGSAFAGFASYKAKDGWDGVPIGNANSQHKTVFAAGLEAGRVLDFGCGFLIKPHVGVDYAYTPTERYRWPIGVRDTIDSQSYWEIPLGVTFSKEFNYGSWLLTPHFDVTMVNSLGKIDPMNAHPGFAYRTANSWKVAGVAGNHVGARLSAGIAAKLNDRTSLGLDYTYEGRKDYNDHRISAMFGLSF